MGCSKMDTTIVSMVLLLIVSQLAVMVSGTCNAERTNCWKTSEAGHSQVDYHLCGDQISDAWTIICYGGGVTARQRQINRRDLSIVQSADEARQFNSKTQRGKRSSIYTITEECCVEGCKQEEIREYC
ncbi:uncharacterized protein LOC116603593 [Nematostella vectensis]|uniref:uncharacterized protein LOC116603593 n=1 Tax=Nematostella vectensis TaxID=45351 RepID=UPI00138FB37F|nr:uncharacterized protein LOC116603593 [Nematostella vectensis]XP_032220952.1 uncharacterized protein LOC116603593 [Nematostella vectensis]